MAYGHAIAFVTTSYRLLIFFTLSNRWFLLDLMIFSVGQIMCLHNDTRYLVFKSYRGLHDSVGIPDATIVDIVAIPFKLSFKA